MIDSTSSSAPLGHEESTEVQSVPVARVWVKPTLERLSLKEALAGAGPVNNDSNTPGS